MNYFEFNKMLQSSVPWWFPFIAPIGCVFVVMWGMMVYDAIAKWRRKKRSS